MKTDLRIRVSVLMVACLLCHSGAFGVETEAAESNANVKHSHTHSQKGRNVGGGLGQGANRVLTQKLAFKPKARSPDTNPGTKPVLPPPTAGQFVDSQNVKRSSSNGQPSRKRARPVEACPSRPSVCPLAVPNGTIGDPQLFRSVCMTHSTAAEPPEKRCLPWKNSTDWSTPDGAFTCGCCGHTLFPANQLFDSNTGWPAFRKASPDGVCHVSGSTEVVCAKCGAHLGDFFPPAHYCIDGVCLHPPKNPVWHAGCEHEHEVEHLMDHTVEFSD